MIINTQQSNVRTIGDIKEFKTSIDPKNLEFITTLLSSNLYSNPEQSFIREIVSNAWDSHVEANNTNTPVIIKISSSSYNNYSITVRDYGVGLSPERFKTIFCNIGSSTKRDSNDYIGCFGIGRFASLACSSSVYITSYYNGIEYQYIMVKSGNCITTNLVHERLTEEKNGVEITIENIRDIDKYVKALDYIIFFPNVYIDGYCSNNINNAKIKKFINFAVSDKIIKHKLLLGNVLYPCDNYNLSDESRQFIATINYTGIVIKFDIGELDITPNREAIIYTSSTIKKIEEKIRKAKEEIEGMVSKHIKQDYDDIREYHEFTTSLLYYSPLTDSLGKDYGYPIYMKDLNITYKNVKFTDEEEDFLRIILGSEPLYYKGAFDNNKLCRARLPYSKNLNQFNSKNVLILNRDARLIPSAKSYISSNYNNYTIVTEFSEDEFNSYIENTCPMTKNSSVINKDLILKGIYNSFIKNAVRLDLTTDKEFLEYKKSESLRNKKDDLKTPKEVILRVSSNGYYPRERRFKSIFEAVTYLKSLKAGVILTDMDVSLNLFQSLAKWKKGYWIRTRKDVLNRIKKLNLKCLIDVDWLTKDDLKMRKLSAIIKHFQDPSDFYHMGDMVKTIPDNLKNEFNEIGKLFSESNYNIRTIAKNAEPDSYTEKMCIALKKYLNAYRHTILTTGYDAPIELIAAFIIKSKFYRVNFNTYYKYKNSELIKVLCKK